MAYLYSGFRIKCHRKISSEKIKVAMDPFFFLKSCKLENNFHVFKKFRIIDEDNENVILLSGMQS